MRYTEPMENTKTIYDIAKEAGVSASTVSRVVNDRPGINENTRRRVRELLDKYNYSPNEAARGLVNQSSRIIGILIEDIRISHHTESAYIIEQEMTRLGYTCITLSTGDSPERKAECIQILTKRRVEGVILMGSMLGTEAVKQSIAEHMARIPVVIVNGSLSLPNVRCVLADEEQGVKLCTELLIRKGKRRLAFACEACTPSAANKLSGFVSAMTQAGAGEDKLRIYKGCETGSADLAPEHTLLAGQELTRRILEEHPDTDGIIYAVDLLAIGGLRELARREIAVPEQVSVIGIDNTLYGKICTPPLTTLDNKLVDLSRTASRLLLDALEGRQTARQTRIGTDIIERGTT